MTQEFATVTTSVSDQAEALSLARTLVERRLVACAQILPIHSVYRWSGKIEEAAEFLLICKIKAVDFKEVSETISQCHGYDVPEIVMSPISAGHAAYLAWIGECVER